MTLSKITSTIKGLLECSASKETSLILYKNKTRVRNYM